jgi:hypothetical protein
LTSSFLEVLFLTSSRLEVLLTSSFLKVLLTYSFLEVLILTSSLLESVWGDLQPYLEVLSRGTSVILDSSVEVPSKFLTSPIEVIFA